MNNILKTTKYKDQIVSLNEVCVHGHTYYDLFKMVLNDDMKYSAKIRNINDIHIAESLKYLSQMKDSAGIISNYYDVIKTKENYILISKWIEGNHPDNSDKDILEKASSALAQFNKDNTHTGPYTSMYMDSVKYNTIEELVDGETQPYLANYKGTHSIKFLRSCLDKLKSGLGCLILEDINIGNILIENTGRLNFIDTEYMTAGLNLYQFEHINLLKFDQEEWFNISKNADKILITYFKTLGEPNKRASAQTCGYYVLSILRKLFFLQRQKKEIDYNEIDGQIEKAAAVDLYSNSDYK